MCASLRHLGIRADHSCKPNPRAALGAVPCCLPHSSQHILGDCPFSWSASARKGYENKQHKTASRSHGACRSPRQGYQLQRGFHHAQNSSSLPPLGTGLLATPCSPCLFPMQNNPGFTQQEVRKVQEAWALQPRFGYVPTRNELVLAVGSRSALAAPIPSAPPAKSRMMRVLKTL